MPTLPAKNDTVRPKQSDRITVGLIPLAAQDLQRLQELTGLSKTDIVNRAVTLYRFVEAQLRERRDLIVRDRRSGESQLIRLT